MMGAVFLIHAVMLIGFERFEFYREGNSLILHGQQTHPPTLQHRMVPDSGSQDNTARKKRKDRRQMST
jgi:hypothetical protein